MDGSSESAAASTPAHPSGRRRHRHHAAPESGRFLGLRRHRAQHDPHGWRRLPVCFIFIGAILLLTTAFFTLQKMKFTRLADRADAEIVAPAPGDPVDNRGHSTVFSFVDDDGKPHRAVAYNWQGSAGRKIGETVEILYLPDQPNTVQMQSFRTLWLEHTLWGLAGLGCFAIGVFGLILGSHRHPDHRRVHVHI